MTGSPLRGLGLAAVSAASFGTSGSLAAPLLRTGWSPAAAVTARLLVAAAVLTPAALRVMRGRWALYAAQSRVVLAYGLVAAAGAQWCFFNAVTHLSVGIALLLEYLGTVLIVGWLWVRHHQPPRRLTTAGIAVVVVGLALVLGVWGQHHLDPVGVLWGLGAALGLATFFVLSARVDDDLPPLALAWGGLVTGGVALVLLGLAKAVPFTASASEVVLVQHRMSWLVPVLGLSLVAAVTSYLTGIRAARVLGAKVASFVGLSEVLFAALFAWLLLGQRIGAVQMLGGLLVLTGVALVRIDERGPSQGRPTRDEELVAEVVRS